MSLIVVNGSEMIRYNPSTLSIEASNSEGFSWSMRYRCSDMGNVRALTLHKGEIILCSDKGICVSKNAVVKKHLHQICEFENYCLPLHQDYDRYGH